MKMFKEYLIDKKCSAPQNVYMVQGAEVVNVQDTDKGLMLIALRNSTNSLTELHTFKICSNNENIHTDTVKYIGSYQSLLGIQHVIEIIKE